MPQQVIADGQRKSGRPWFMTRAMWFAWLLRSDARGGYDTGDREGQREFVCWWLLFGRSEYGAVWWYGPSQVSVAMQTVCVGTKSAGIRQMPRLLRRIYRSRPDLQRSFDLSDERSYVSFLCWYRIYGAGEVASAPLLPERYLQMTESASHPAVGGPIPPMAVTLWTKLDELKAAVDMTQEGHLRGLAAWYFRNGRFHIPPPSPLPSWAEVVPHVAAPPSAACAGSIILVGFARAEFGIGEDVRALSRALDTVGLKHTITDRRPGTAIQVGDRTRAHLIRDVASRASFKIFCMTAFDMAELFLKEGLAPFENGFNIGYWPWELPRFPAEWIDVYGLAHEIWAASRSQATAYRVNSPVPVASMPPAIDPPRPRARLRHLRRRVFRFIHPFDPNSTLARKNPLASVKAFQRAFPRADQSVELVLRINGRISLYPGWRELRAAIRNDRRVKVMEGTRPHLEALRLLQQADCLVSPHRAEGLGRNIGEAKLLGVPVLATGYSGSSDLLEKHEQIPSRLRRLRPGEYPFGDGQAWAEPNLKMLALRMRELRFAARPNVTARSFKIQRFARVYATSAAGRRYRNSRIGKGA